MYNVHIQYWAFLLTNSYTTFTYSTGLSYSLKVTQHTHTVLGFPTHSMLHNIHIQYLTFIITKRYTTYTNSTGLSYSPIVAQPTHTVLAFHIHQ